MKFDMLNFLIGRGTVAGTFARNEGTYRKPYRPTPKYPYSSKRQEDRNLRKIEKAEARGRGYP